MCMPKYACLLCHYYYTIVHILIRIMQTACICVIDILVIYDSDYIPISWLTGAVVTVLYFERLPFTIISSMCRYWVIAFAHQDLCATTARH